MVDPQFLSSAHTLTFSSSMLSFHADACLDRVPDISALQQAQAYFELSHIVAFHLYDSYYY